MRESLTDKSGRALCLAYRNGRRCRRLATVVVNGQAMCAECAAGLPVRDRCERGFTVKTHNSGGWISRHYHPIKEG